LDEGDRRSGVVQDRVDQEAAVAGDVVLEPLGILDTSSQNVCWKKRDGRAGLERSSGCCDGNQAGENRGQTPIFRPRRSEC